MIPAAVQPSLLCVRSLAVEPAGRGLFERARANPFALCDVSFDLEAGELVCLIGESGSGKSTLLRALLGLEQASRGSAKLALAQGTLELLGQDTAGRRRGLANIGWIPQDPGAALDPRCTLLESVAEPLLLHARASASNARSRALQLIELSGLARTCAERLPHQLSGGERQRGCLARALALDPALLLLDEPTSSLDASIAAHWIDLVGELVRERRLGALWVTHDIALARWCSQRVLVIEAGRLVEGGATGAVLGSPASRAAQKLVRAAAWNSADQSLIE